MRNGLTTSWKHGLRLSPIQSRAALAVPRRWQSTTRKPDASQPPQPSVEATSTPTPSVATPKSAPATTPSVPPPSFSLPQRQWSTQLAENIAKAIEVTGPISIASYMRQCLTSPDGGYYTTTRPSSDQFGVKGDFITSPEISQIFGELVGLWFLTEWMGQGRLADGVHFMEVGPGRGTLMDDVLRTAAQFKSFAKAIEAVWLVEAGEGLRQQQCDLLCGEGIEMKAVEENGRLRYWEAPSKYGNGIIVKWVEDVALLPENNNAITRLPFIIAHEFFDALPIHAFESIAAAPEQEKTQLLDKHGRPMIQENPASKIPQWRELLVSPTRPLLHLFTSSPDTGLQPKMPDADFNLTIAKASNANSLVIPERPRYKKLKQQPSSRIEVSPESYRYIQDFAKRIGGNKSSSKPSGAALIIDYGPLDTIPVDSLRGIKEHKIVSPFAFAGQADISADVDFGALADAALEGSEGVEIHGPIEQGAWLGQLGIQARAETLLKNTEESKRAVIETAWKRLVEGGPKGMGKAYKVMAILPENGGKRRPVGFGGVVAG